MKHHIFEMVNGKLALSEKRVNESEMARIFLEKYLNLFTLDINTSYYYYNPK